MTYKSVDQLQNLLVRDVFHYTANAKKAAGRALGTLVEIITFYLLKSWELEYSVAIETRLKEYGNPNINHNVEYSLHPIIKENGLVLSNILPITSNKILKEIPTLTGFKKTNNVLLTTNNVLRNCCILAKSNNTQMIAMLDSIESNIIKINIVEQILKPYSMVECKRVGIEEGMKKGPQTIEKAKQGAYVSNSISSLQKTCTSSGELKGIIYKPNDEIYSLLYDLLIKEIIKSDEAWLLQDFILSVGVVSNHGNWFTEHNQNKEIKILAQSYDWLLFLRDQGLAEFITELLLEPATLLGPVRNAFLASYTGNRNFRTQFTKVQMNYPAHLALQQYFMNNKSNIEQWFNIISPNGQTINELKLQLKNLRNKNWRQVHLLWQQDAKVLHLPKIGAPHKNM